MLVWLRLYTYMYVAELYVACLVYFPIISSDIYIFQTTLHNRASTYTECVTFSGKRDDDEKDNVKIVT